ncbi:fatty acyl-CoA reductase 2, chloroplastic-like [Solanum dulcamara]|uniref:fatty acyl-CoA reductase 2, chloroplastic-like n=1 Tax=Solanum dulcamara TaxID=45834 RepID=UPI002486AE3B|nr:fatty acyl-CoA reductase 2, chloroplastic-like [Solanum dulcamara]
MTMLHLQNIFSLNTRVPTTKLFSENSTHFSSKFSYKIRSNKTSDHLTLGIDHGIGPSNSSSIKALGDHHGDVLAKNGIGIVDFFEAKNLLVTGATGFLAKVLIEKMLRTTPKINKIYLLIRAKNREAAFDRLTSEIIESKLFKCLKEIHGKSYESFIRSKLIPVVGNIHEPNLGMDIIISQQIVQEIDLIVGSAANTTFDLRYDLALDANVNGSYQLMMFAKKCKNLKLLIHYSSAYANGEREGLLYEKPFIMGESITKEKLISHSPSAKFPSLNAANELDFVSKLKNAIKNNGFEQIMKDLGAERAKLYGWHDTYSFTKAIGEMVINSMREDIPIVIIRPSTITSSYEQPFPGWVQGFRVIDPAIVFYGKGDFPAVLADPNCIVDVVSVDVVVNATMAAIAKHGYLQSPELNVYHVASSFVNPLLSSQLLNYCYEFFSSFPFVNSKGDQVKVKKMKYCDNMSDFSNYISKELLKQHDEVGELTHEVEHSKMQMRFKRKVEYLKNFSKVYEPYAFYKGWFHNGNMQKLMEDMSEQERKSFEIDLSKINWRDYFIGIHIPGVKKHVLKGRIASS